jgi:hypothetical protein
MLADLRPLVLTEYLGTQFEVLDDPSRVFCLTLDKVVEHARTERHETFSIYFRGPSGAFLAQGIHKLKHEKLGELGIFLVPIGQDQDGFQYEAVFNHTLH